MDNHHEANGTHAIAEPDAAERWRRYFASLTPEQQELCKHHGPPKRSPEMQQYMDEMFAKQAESGGLERLFGIFEPDPDEDEDAFWAALEEMS